MAARSAAHLHSALRLLEEQTGEGGDDSECDFNYTAHRKPSRTDSQIKSDTANGTTDTI